MIKKLRQRLEIGSPVFFINSTLLKHDLTKSLELQDFQCSVDRLSWTVRCGNGELISGGIRDKKPIPFFEGCSFCLAIPVKLNLRRKNRLAPDFILEMPSSYIPVSELASVR